MTRGLTTDLQNALRAMVVRPGYLVELETTGPTVYLSTRARNVEYDGHTWLGNSWLRPTFKLHESVELRANGASINIAGIDPTAISLTLQSFNHSKKGKIILVAFDEAGSLVLDPFQAFEGNFDNADIRDSGDSSDIVLNYENEFIRGKTAEEYRMTHFSQQSRYPSDMGFQYTAQVEDWSGFWGKAARPNFQKKRKTRNDK